jgi:hypothetical protein
MLGGHLITSHQIQLTHPKDFWFCNFGKKKWAEVTRFPEISLLEIVIFKQ